MSRRTVAIVQSYVARYRVEFYNRLSHKLAGHGFDLRVVAGSPGGVQALRGDGTEQSQWLRFAQPHRKSIGNKAIPPFYGTTRHWRDCDGVILTLRGNSFDLNAELARKPFSRRRVATWGHVGAFVKDPNPVDTAIERRQMILCDHVFAYTQAGADVALESGIATNKVTAVMNSTDVSETLAQSDSISRESIDEFEWRHGLTRGKTFGYIGGIDSPKRVDLLAVALDIVWERDPHIKFIVGGRGDKEHLLSSAADRGQVIRLGYAGPHEKALINHVSEYIVNPGRIGLLAVECMAMSLPILTTDWKYHGPEYEYLTEGVDVFTSSSDPERFADLICSRTARADQCRRPQPGPYPTLNSMVDNFASGVLRMMS